MNTENNFSFNKIKINNCIAHCSFWTYYWKYTCFFYYYFFFILFYFIFLFWLNMTRQAWIQKVEKGRVVCFVLFCFVSLPALSNSKVKNQNNRLQSSIYSSCAALYFHLLKSRNSMQGDSGVTRFVTLL